MDYLSSNKVAVIDLATSEIEEQELEEELVREHIGGAGITSALYERFEAEEPIALGAGLLTGTLVPGSALAVMTAKNPHTGNKCHVPITLDAGMELKYSGFDYLVIKGKSQVPVYLWIHDGITDIRDAKDLWGKDVWAATDHVREYMGDKLIQVLGIGKAGESRSNLACVCVNYWHGGDRTGLGMRFGEKNLKLVALRGMGLLEIAEPDGFVAQCAELLTAFKSGGKAGNLGIAEMAVTMGGEDLRDWLHPLVHRHMACFNTPFATNTFVFLNESPEFLKESAVTEPGFLISDLYPLAIYEKLGLTASDACGLLRDCAKYGLDGAAVAFLSRNIGLKDPKAIRDAMAGMKGPVPTAGTSVFSEWASVGKQEPDDWKRRQAVAYLFGIHPIYALMAPELSEEKLLDLANLGTGLDFTQKTLDQAVERIMEG
ncbi:MAG: aldehyde ferredoxin oxidoreductase N-terminal domain-containing protein [Desulfatiglandales bacterium]